ncbi:protein of unknown function [Streptomyces murinus]
MTRITQKSRILAQPSSAVADQTCYRIKKTVERDLPSEGDAGPSSHALVHAGTGTGVPSVGSGRPRSRPFSW